MPRVHMTPMARLALFFLRAYLILLLGLILMKFIRGCASSAPPTTQPATTQPTTTHPTVEKGAMG